MHACSPCAGAPSLQVFPRKCQASAGFSLVEIALSIGVIAVAFVSLIGLLPTGLRVFRESVDATNEMWIAQNLNAMIQVTSWSQIEDLEQFRFYFDEEGRLTDRVSPDDGEEADEDSVEKRLYAVKLLIAKPTRPGDSGVAPGAREESEFSENVVRVVTVIAPYVNPSAMKEFNALHSLNDLPKLGKASALKTRAFLVTRMDSMREADTSN